MLVAFRQADHRRRLRAERDDGLARGAHLTDAAVDHEQARKLFALLHQPAVTARDDLGHGAEVVVARETLYPEFPVSGFVRFAVAEERHRRHAKRGIPARPESGNHVRRPGRQRDEWRRPHTPGVDAPELADVAVVERLVDESVRQEAVEHCDVCRQRGRPVAVRRAHGTVSAEHRRAGGDVAVRAEPVGSQAVDRDQQDVGGRLAAGRSLPRRALRFVCGCW